MSAAIGGAQIETSSSPEEVSIPQVIGRVTASSGPLRDATVLVYDERASGWLHADSWSLLRSPPEVLQQVKTDVEGRFTLNGLPEHQVMLAIHAAGHASRYELLRFVRDQGHVPRVLAIALGTGCDTTIRLQQEDGTPLPRTRLLLFVPETRTSPYRPPTVPFEASSDDRGDIHLPHLDRDSYSVALPIGDEGHFLFHYALEYDGRTSDIDDATLMVPPTQRLRGRVLDPEGQPVSTASVQVILEADRDRVFVGTLVTDAQGRIDAELPFRTVEHVSVTHSAFLGRTLRKEEFVRQENAEGCTYTFEVALVPRPLQRVQLIDRLTQRPIAGARARWASRWDILVAHPSPTTITDDEGRFSLRPRNANRTTLEIDAEGYWTPRPLGVLESTEAYLVPGGRRGPAPPHPLWGLYDVTWNPEHPHLPRTIELGRPGSVRGRVIDDRGRGVPGMEVSVYTAASTHSPVKIHEEPSGTDGDGWFHIEDLPPGVTLELQARSPFVEGRSDEFTLQPGRTLADVNVVIHDATTVHVEVRDADGLALPFAWVTLHHPELPAFVNDWTVVTDLDGKALFPGVLVGEVELEVAAPGHTMQTRTLDLASGRVHTERVILERKE
ncbi:MAG: carboxypeptidase regulatory-like domain-containing protein [Planctomycetes bacterium]|nr:carboxypeptidase regulatory-like domain-containing protein [Planctomycetota bacterium]